MHSGHWLPLTAHESGSAGGGGIPWSFLCLLFSKLSYYNFQILDSETSLPERQHNKGTEPNPHCATKACQMLLQAFI